MTLPNNQLTPLPDNAPAVPATWNSRFNEMDANFQYLDAQTMQALTDLGLLDGRVMVLEADSSASVSSAVKLDWLYRNFMMVIEMWTPHWTLLDPIALAVTGAVGGDDSVDVATTAGLVVGNEYVLYDSVHQESIVVESILTSTRFRTKTDMVHSYTSAILKRCNFSFSGGATHAAAGKVYYCGPVFLGNNDVDKAIVIRRQDNDTALRLYYKDANHSVWTEAHWDWLRTISDGVIDVEYRLPARANFELKLVSEDGATSNQVIIYHIAGVYAATGLKGVHRSPDTPVNSLPASGATNVQETPTLSAAGYSHAAGTPLAGLQVQLGTDPADFTDPLLDSGFRPGGISYSIVAGFLAVSTVYYWRMRVRDTEGAWSAWSTPTGFTSAASFAYVVTPTNSAPANNAADVTETPTLSSSAFAVYGTTDTHSKSQWQIRLGSGSYDAPIHDSGESNDKISHVVPSGLLRDGRAQYFYRVRHKATTHGWSDWSNETQFTTAVLFSRIFGLACVAGGGGSGTWQHVDGDGNNFTPGATYFSTHPIYRAIQDVQRDGQAMVQIPKFYFKVGNAPGGSNQAGKKCWWISSAPASGYGLHPAFKKDGAEIDYFLVGKYEATGSTTLLGSVAGAAPLTNQLFGAFQTAAYARNATQGSSLGWHIVTAYEFAAIQMLCLLELGGPNVQASIAAGNVSSAVVANTGSTAAVWRGIYELWGNTRTWVAGIKITSQAPNECPLYVYDLNGYKTFVRCPMASVLDGWVTTMRSDSGDEGGSMGGAYNFAALFVPSAVDADQADGTFADRSKLYQQYGTECSAVVGGHCSDGDAAGLFNMQFIGPILTGSNSTTGFVGTRLAQH